MTFVIGLTGGIGCGKTLISDHLASLGVPIIDTDIIARQIVEPNSPTLSELVDTFGEEILLEDGSLNRGQLRKLAFSNSENKQKLDAITHPAILDEAIRQLEQVEYSYVIVVIPLLSTESAFFPFLDRVLTVNTDQETRIQRVMKRNNLPRDTVEKIVATQLTDIQRQQFADDQIDNNGSKQATKQQASQLHQKYLELAQKHA